MPVPKKSLKHPEISLENDVESPMKLVVSSIHKVAKGFEELNNCGLSRRALVLLLHDATKVGKKDINEVLEAAPLLAERYLEGPEEHPEDY